MSIDERLERIESMLAVRVARQTVREWYTTDEFAQLVGKAELTVREWCRHGRIRAEKRLSGRGAHPSWVINHAELLRFQREGLLPMRAQCHRKNFTNLLPSKANSA
jgi:Helix-turn-helix domain